MLRRMLGLIVASAVVGAWAQTPGTVPSFAPYGMGMYRLRYSLLDSSDAAGNDFSAGNYSNRLAYRVGLKATINEQVSGQFEIGNDWFSTEEVTGLPLGNYAGRRSPLTPWFSLAFMQWNPEYLYVQAGVVPVKGSSPLDLIGNSLFRNQSYREAPHVPWGVLTNFGRPGLRLGAPVVKQDFKLGVDLFTTVVEQRNITMDTTFRINSSAIMFILDVPMSLGGLTLTPQFVPIFNRNHDKDDHASDHEIAFGVDATYKLNDGVSFRAGAGYAMVSNEKTWDPTDSVFVPGPSIGQTVGRPDARNDQTGAVMTVGSTIKAGPGRLEIDLSYGFNDNALIANEANAGAFPYADVKYAFLLNKNFVITPRVRVFVSQFENDAVRTLAWPEIMFIGSF